jgi:hypothetical protein
VEIRAVAGHTQLSGGGELKNKAISQAGRVYHTELEASINPIIMIIMMEIDFAPGGCYNLPGVRDILS